MHAPAQNQVVEEQSPSDCGLRDMACSESSCLGGCAPTVAENCGEPVRCGIILDSLGDGQVIQDGVFSKAMNPEDRRMRYGSKDDAAIRQEGLDSIRKQLRHAFPEDHAVVIMEDSPFARRLGDDIHQFRKAYVIPSGKVFLDLAAHKGSSVISQNAHVVAPPPLECEGVEIEKLKGGCPPTSCSESSFDLREAEDVMRNMMEGLGDLVKPCLTQEFLSVDIEVIRQHIHELFECGLGECLTIWSEEIPENLHLGGRKRAIPLLVLAWRCLHGLDQPVQRVDSIAGDSSREHGGSQKVDPPEVVEFWNHLISFPNADVVAPPPLESEGGEMEKLKGGCPPTSCSESLVGESAAREKIKGRTLPDDPRLALLELAEFMDSYVMTPDRYVPAGSSSLDFDGCWQTVSWEYDLQCLSYEAKRVANQRES